MGYRSEQPIRYTRITTGWGESPHRPQRSPATRAPCVTRAGARATGSHAEVKSQESRHAINPASRTPVKVKTGPSSSLYVALMLGLMLFGLIRG